MRILKNLQVDPTTSTSANHIQVLLSSLVKRLQITEAFNMANLYRAIMLKLDGDETLFERIETFMTSDISPEEWRGCLRIVKA